MRSNLQDFEQKARLSLKRRLLSMRRPLIEIGVFTYEKLLERTEDASAPDSGALDTGAYRSEHVIESDKGEVIYESPDRVGPNTKVPSIGSPYIPRPDIGSVRIALEAGVTRNIRRLTFINRRFYAEYIEGGSARINPRLIYTRTQQSVEAEIESISARIRAEDPEESV